MTRHTNLTNLGLCTSCLLSGLATSHSLMAQDAPANQDRNVEQIVVTGSFIKGKEQGTSASPIAVIGEDDLNNIGATSVSDLVNTLTINTGAQVYSDSFEQARSAGTTNINLRGLGVTSTLVLLNGQRHTLSPAVTEAGDQFVDLSTLVPAIAVERVEILKDGASSLYGSDAVAGVVNFITRSTFEGFELDANYQHNKYGSDEVSLGAIVGAAGERSNLMFAVNYLKRTNVPNSARRDDYADNQDSWSGYGFPGKVIAFDGPPGPPIKLIDPSCLDGSAFEKYPGLVRRKPDGEFPSDGACELNYGYYGDIIAAAEQTQAMAQATFDLTDSTQLFSELVVARNKTTINSVPSQPQLDEVRVPAYHPDAIEVGGPDPFPGSASNSGVLFIRPLGAGSEPNKDDKVYQSWRYQLGLKGDLTNDWSWKATWTTSVNEAENARKDVITNNLQAALNGQGGPNGDAFYYWLSSSQDKNTPEMYDFIFGEFGYQAKSSQSVFDAHVTGDLFELPAGSLGAAFGVQHRTDKLEYDFNELSNDLVFNFFGGGEDFTGEQKVWAAFAEFSIPLTYDLTMQTAIRYEDFDLASTTDPKVALLWTPSQDFSLRASYGTSFRVATVFQNDSQFITPQTANDPLAGGDEVSFISLLTGDPERPLKPQESEAVNLGMSWTFAEDVTLNLDYWRFDYKNFITPESAAALLAVDPTSSQIERGPGGEAVKITTYYRNAGSVQTDGIDFSLFTDLDMGEWGNLRPMLDGTYLLSYDLDDPLLGPIDGLGNVNDENFGVSTVELRANLGLLWSNGKHSGNLYVRHIGDYQNDNEDNAKVASWTKIDMQYIYQMDPLLSTGEGPRLMVGAQNLFDRAAPTVRNSLGYDATVHDPRGRMVYVNIKQAF
ncbi:TonB-dependent receptor [Bowmanella sp. Y26]|uniref:TonB-dependent receptor n=1 Tax=Bowmanella yangjiangensis TaxID=2811230 RepID=UPI001BDD804C|nr:TonB-dependent receptor [Bowmanella yangjiangensis]MBT1064313.1 TonB-dependent receptor [Bowmanella yangjiangensis]